MNAFADAEAEKELRQVFDEVFSKLQPVPLNPIASVHSVSQHPGGSVVIICDTVDGETLVVGIAPGKPVHVAIET